MEPEEQHAERDIYNIKEVYGDVVVQNRGQPERPRKEQTLLKAVKREIKDRLKSSLHNAVLLNLGKESQPDQVTVTRPWNSEIKLWVETIEAMPDDTPISQVFDSVEGKLLILGNPGSGKTTALLDLAKALIDKAEDDSSYPIPVLLNLSSWRDEKQLIRDWMVTELKSKYGATPKLTQEWVAERVLLPLLDGLDEVTPERQEKCVQQLNTFLGGEASPLYAVVCSRIAEYENYETPLQLNGAVYLKELSDTQMQDYLSRVERAELWQYISCDKKLLEVVRAPLLLSMAILAYPQGPIDQWQQVQKAAEQVQKAADPLQLLLDTYVERMLHREFVSRAYGKNTSPTVKQARWWLVWLAQQMAVSQTEFLIEEMQPRMLPDGARWKYRLLVGTVRGTVVWLLVGLLVGTVRGTVRGTVVWLLVGLLVGLFCGTVRGIVGVLSGVLRGGTVGGNIKPVEKLAWSWEKARESLFIGLGIGLFVGLVGVLGGGTGSGVVGRTVVGTVVGLLGIVLLVVLLVGLLSGLSFDEIKVTTKPNQGMWNSAKNFVFAVLFVVLFAVLVGGLVGNLLGDLLGGLLGGLFVGLLGGLFVGLDYGGTACIQHFTLRLSLFWIRHTPWNYARFLNYCTERLFLQRVGGRYRFVHKLLQDHFAKMPVRSFEQ